MPKSSGSVRQFAAVSFVARIVIAPAVGVTIWRYEEALAASRSALDARHDSRLTEKLVAIFWHEHEAMNEHLTAPTPASLHEVSRQRAAFAATSATLGQSQTLAEEGFRSRARAGNRGFVALFTRIRGAGQRACRDQSSPRPGRVTDRAGPARPTLRASPRVLAIPADIGARAASVGDHLVGAQPDAAHPA
jgi:hypothetical protein